MLNRIPGMVHKLKAKLTITKNIVLSSRSRKNNPKVKKLKVASIVSQNSGNSNTRAIMFCQMR
jgi:hypothetical protein